MKSGYNYVPAKPILDALGYPATVASANKSLTAKRGSSYLIRIRTGEREAYIKTKDATTFKTLGSSSPAAATWRNNTVFVPLSFLAREYGYTLLK
jgi:hypothetical protein